MQLRLCTTLHWPRQPKNPQKPYELTSSACFCSCPCAVWSWLGGMSLEEGCGECSINSSISRCFWGKTEKEKKRDCPDGGDASHLFQFIIGNTVMCLEPQINQSLCGASHSYLTASFSWEESFLIKTSHAQSFKFAFLRVLSSLNKGFSCWIW